MTGADAYPSGKPAYAIFAGGGSKGVVLVGSLAAAQELGFSFLGYAGTSAGSIISLLACVGYTGQELRTVLASHPMPQAFLEVGSQRLATVLRSVGRYGLLRGLFSNHWRTLWVFRRLREHLGVCEGAVSQQKLADLIREKLPPELRPAAEHVTFRDLHDAGMPGLKILASDITRRCEHVYSSEPNSDPNTPVIDAVRASISYPLMFRPVQVYNRYLVDGGLTANLPFFLFDEQRSDRLPVFAFDLITRDRASRGGRYGLEQFLGDLAATALQSSQRLHLQRFRDVHYVPIEVEGDVDAFTALDDDGLSRLFDAGYAATRRYLTEEGTPPNRRKRPWNIARTEIEWLQSLYAPPVLVRPVLQALVREVEQGTPARGVRANVMVPTGRGTRKIVYQHGMDDDSDREIELDTGAGCSGLAWSNRQPAWVDLVEDARTTYASLYGLTDEQQQQVREDRSAVFSVPIFAQRTGDEIVADTPVIGVLSVDSSTPFADTEWYGKQKAYMTELGKLWALMLSRILD